MLASGAGAVPSCVVAAAPEEDASVNRRLRVGFAVGGAGVLTYAPGMGRIGVIGSMTAIAGAPFDPQKQPAPAAASSSAADALSISMVRGCCSRAVGRRWRDKIQKQARLLLEDALKRCRVYLLLPACFELCLELPDCLQLLS